MESNIIKIITSIKSVELQQKSTRFAITNFPLYDVRVGIRLCLDFQKKIASFEFSVYGKIINLPWALKILIGHEFIHYFKYMIEFGII